MIQRVVVLSILMIGACKSKAPPQGPTLYDIGPRIISNQTDNPVYLYGQNFVEGLSLDLGTGTAIPTHFVDSEHLLATIPAGIATSTGGSHQTLSVSLQEKEGRASLTVVNDQEFPTPIAMEISKDQKNLFAVSPTTDMLWTFDLQSGALSRVRVGDGPRALGRYEDAAKKNWLVILHEFSGDLRLVDVNDAKVQRLIPVGPSLQGLYVDSRKHRAYVTSNFSDSVHVIDLTLGREINRYAVGVNPRALTQSGDTLVVSNLGSNDVSLVNLTTGKEQRVVATPGTTILGGETEKFSEYVMGSKSCRDLLAYGDYVFCSSIGPNIGPNPQKMEVSMNGGITVIDVKNAIVLRHVSMLHGVPEGLDLDERTHTLYAADIARGRLVSLDAKKLVAFCDGPKCRQDPSKALQSAVDIAPPADTEFVRPVSDFGINNRATTAMHSGPKDVRLGQGKVYVLNRFTGTVSEFAARKTPKLLRTFNGPKMTTQRVRRLGEVLYFTDLGDSRMTCDTCHLDGHNDGILFEKTEPLHIYRVTSLRASKESAPYFTPSLIPNLKKVMLHVGARNRFQNPKPTATEATALALYNELITPLPNPYIPQAKLPTRIRLPDGKTGSPAVGLAVFGKLGCGTANCHPAPHFTADQSPNTRGTMHDVGTPVTLPLRPTMQVDAPYPLPPPSLVGVWDNFPLLHSGGGGLAVLDDGTIRATRPFALRHVLDFPHGDAQTLSEQERNDLLSYLLTL